MKAFLTAESFGEEVRFRDISSLSYKHSNCPAYSERSDDYFIKRVHDIEDLPVYMTSTRDPSVGEWPTSMSTKPVV